MKTFKIVSLGCKVNYYEKQAIASFLESKGLLEVEEGTSNIVIVNTCTVTEEGSRKSKQIIRRMIKENPGSIICAMGCLTQVDPNIQQINGLSVILGANNKALIYDAIVEFEKTGNPVFWVKKDVFHEEYDNFTVKHFETHTRAFLKVEDGCTNMCSYCIIPYVRGNIRSKSKDIAIEETKELVRNGHKEIIISGIHTGAYGKDLGISLTDLLKELAKINGLERIRISSIESNQISDELIELIKSNKKFTHHLHIPLQAASNHVLKLMGRHYTIEEFMERIDYIRNQIPGIAITTDYIVGFPEETDEDFNQSIEYLKKIRFETIHTFPYSLREGTKAAKMIQIDPKIKKERSKRVLELSNNSYVDYVNENIGKNLDVIFETYTEPFVFGHTGNYIYVKALGSISDLNKLMNVAIIKYESDATLAKIKER